MTVLPKEQRGDLEDLAALFPEIPIVLIGASALALQLEPGWRRTFDLDLSLALPIEAYPGALAHAEGWHQESGSPIRWTAPRGTRLDVIPAGPEEVRRGSVEWPGQDRTFSLIGFRLVFDKRQALEGIRDAMISVAPVPVIALLKMVSYQESPATRERDLEDLAYVFDRYPETDDDRRYSDAALDSGLPSEAIGAFVLGTELGAMVNERERSEVERWIAMLLEESDGGRARALMLRGAPPSWKRDPEQLLERVGALKTGLASR